MEIREFQELSKRTMPQLDSQINADGDVVTMSKPLILANYALGLTGEGGEVADVIKKHVFHGHLLDKEAVKKELGDILHYVAGIATLLELNMESVLEGNIEKLKKRFPNGFSSADSIRRADVNTNLTK